MTSSEPLSADELRRLEAYLLTADERFAPLISELDGFLAALAILPEPIPQQEWLSEILGPSREVLDDAVHPDEILALILRMQHEVASALAADPPTYAALLDEDTDGSLMGEIWAEGFTRAVSLRQAAWDELAKSKVVARMIAPIAFLGDYELFCMAYPKAKKREALSLEYASDITLCTLALYRFARMTPLERLNADATLAQMDRKKHEADEALRNRPKAGRNEPCPCGSGKKFKRCCGAPA
jgi:uncharacterized protein